MSTRGVGTLTVLGTVRAMELGLMVPPPRFCADALEYGPFHKAGTGLLKLVQPRSYQNRADGEHARLTVRERQQDFGRRIKLLHLQNQTRLLMAHFVFPPRSQVGLFVVGECYIPCGREVKKTLTTTGARDCCGWLLHRSAYGGSAQAQVACVIGLGLQPNRESVALGIRQLWPAVDPSPV